MFKVKILYIPTGEFLFHGDGTNGNTIIWTDNDIEITIESLIKRILTVNDLDFIAWKTSNNISLPLLREELEVIHV